MAKVKKAVDAAVDAGRSVKSALNDILDMSTEARKARGEEFGDMVYHGTAEDISEFNPAIRGSNTKATSAHGAFWFVDDPEVAGGYAKMAAEDSPVQRLIDQSYAAERAGKWDDAHDLMVQAEQLEGSLVDAGGQNVMPLRVNNKNLKAIDADGATMSDLDDSQLATWVNEAKAEGYDGLKISNFSDNADWGNYRPATHYAIFEPNNIRSVNAAFDPAKRESANLLAGLGGAAVLGASMEDAEAGPIKVIDKATGKAKTIIEAWHGSPHKFDKFDINKIGTGEGAQAYGHGLYFADSEDVARGYRDNVIDAGYLNDTNARMSELAKIMGADEIPGQYRKYKTDAGRAAAAEYDKLMDAKLANPRPNASLYRTHLDVDPDTLLDWDKPLSEQPENVRRFIEPFKQQRLAVMNQRPGIYTSPPERIVENMTGGEWLDEITGQLAATSDDPAAIGRGAQAYTSKYMKEQGIPGIRYSDGFSRGKEGGTYNYVMFDDKPISIQERGFADPMTLAVTAAITGAATEFYRRRESKKGFWQQRREELSELINAGDEFIRPAMPYINSALEALDKPMQGYYGVASALGALVEGNGLDASLQRGATVARQPIEQTAQEYGGVLADEGYPLAGTALNTAMQVTGPF